ncbi:type VI secretion system baseplate subunit TssE [Pseudomonas aeruginosa]
MSGALPPLFERLSAEADERPAFDDRALAESVRGELLRLLNTRRPANARSGILAYGLADWTAVQRLRAEDRRQLQLGGSLRSGSRLTPALFVIEQGSDGLEVRHERFD